MNNKIIKLILSTALIVGITLAISQREHIDIAAMQLWINGMGWSGIVIFIAIYALAAVLFLPGTVLSLAGGALFGPVLGTAINLTGATLGATLSFLISRHLASQWIQNKAGNTVNKLIRGVDNEGWRFVAFVRLVPLFPFNVLNYALGLTRIKIKHYILATASCMLPGATAITYLGYAGRETLSGGDSWIKNALIALALLAFAAYLPRIINRLRGQETDMINSESLKQKLNDNNEDIVLIDVRTKEEFIGELGHLPGAINIPLDELKARIAELNNYQNKPVIALCRTDRRASIAAQQLKKAGFTNITILKNGMIGWNELSYELSDQ